ncbi:hypothetical protein [Okeania sp. KiyG1]|nr:hypothetical protein [Okeania sp. KiyG1]
MRQQTAESLHITIVNAPTREGKTLYDDRYFPNFYTNDTNGHDMTS